LRLVNAESFGSVGERGEDRKLDLMAYEYKFVRLGESRTSAFFGVHTKARQTYQDVVREHARDGWRLLQIFAPGVAAFGAAKYYELIFERERTDNHPGP
jgi:hypothetical protein